MDTAQILADLRAQRERISQAITALETLEETAVSRPTAKAATKAAAVKSGKTAAVAPPAAKKRVISPEGTQADGGGSAEALGDEEKGSKTCGGREASCPEEGSAQDGQACDQPREPQEDGRGAAEALGEEEESGEGRREEGCCGSGRHGGSEGSREGIGNSGRCAKAPPKRPPEATTSRRRYVLTATGARLQENTTELSR